MSDIKVAPGKPVELASSSIKTLKGFIVLEDKQNNKPGSTSLHGELSNVSLSYSTEVGRYYNDDNNNVGLAAFSFKDQAGQRLVVDEVSLTSVWTICTWVVASSRNGTITQNEAAFKLLIQQTYAETIEFLGSGNHVTDGNVIIPEYIKWRDRATNNIFHLWFVDNSFKTQYDEYEIIIVPPIKDLNQFMESIDVVQPLVEGRSSGETFNELYVLTGAIPFTKPASYPWGWVERENTLHKLVTDWVVGIYGIAGDNPEAVKTAIAKYILANSRYNEVEWAPIFPELFNPSEFVLIPSWGSISIEGGITTDLYQPSINVSSAVGFMSSVCPEYPAKHVLDNLSSIASIYKSINFIGVGAPNNPDKIFRIEEKYPDYILVSNTDKDFARMTQITQEWVGVLHTMLKYAETMTGETVLPLGYYLFRRNGYMFISRRLNGVNYLMVTRQSWLEMFASPTKKGNK